MIIIIIIIIIIITIITKCKDKILFQQHEL